MKLKRVIGSRTILILAINSILGSSIFFLPAIAASYSGTGSIIAWVMMAAAAIAISTYFGELVSKYPKAGGIYEYAKHSLGQSSAFLLGWVSWMVANIAISLEIVGALLYMFPSQPFLIQTALAFLFIAFFNYISYRGMDYSARMLLAFGGITLFSLGAIVLFGSASIRLENLMPLAAPLPMIFLSIYFISDTFFGWESATYLSEEVKNARKVMPRIMVISTVIASALCVALAVVSLGAVNWQSLAGNPASLTLVADAVFGSGAGRVLSAIVFMLIMGSAASWIVASPRLLYAMARDKVIAPGLARIHRKYRTPHNAILFQTAVVMLVTVAGFADYATLLTLILPLEIIIYSALLAIVIKMRMKGVRCGYSSVFGLHGALGLLLFNAFLLYTWLLQPGSMPVFAMSMMLGLFGLPLYVLIKLSTDKLFIEKFFDRISFLWDRSLPLWYTEKEARHIIGRIKTRKGMAVLDFGCGSGITTLEMAKKLGTRGTIVAVDLSKKQLEKAFHKIDRAMKISNVIFVKEPELTFKPDTFHAVIAAGVLEHLDNPQQTMTHLMRLLKRGGEFSFFSFGKSFGIPAPEFLQSKAAIEKFFSYIGLKPNIKIEEKKFTEYIHIWGKKPPNWKG